MAFLIRDFVGSIFEARDAAAAAGYSNRLLCDFYQVQNFIMSPSSLEEKKHRFDYFHKYVVGNWDPTDSDYAMATKEGGMYAINCCVLTSYVVARVLLRVRVRRWFRWSYEDRWHVRMWNTSIGDWSYYPVTRIADVYYTYGYYNHYYQMFYYPKHHENGGIKITNSTLNGYGRLIQGIVLDDDRRLFLMGSRYPFSPFMTENAPQMDTDLHAGHWRVQRFDRYQDSVNPTYDIPRGY